MPNITCPPLITTTIQEHALVCQETVGPATSSPSTGEEVAGGGHLAIDTAEIGRGHILNIFDKVGYSVHTDNILFNADETLSNKLTK